MKRILIVGLLSMLVLSQSGYSAEKYVITLENGKVKGYQKVTDEYLSKFSKDATSPLKQPGAILVNSLEGYEMADPPKKQTEKERILDAIGLTMADIDKIKAIK